MTQGKFRFTILIACRGSSPAGRKVGKYMREKFARFMAGRYGVDEFSRFVLGAALVLMVVNLFLRWRLLNPIVLLMLIYVYYRMFSRNLQKRYAENAKFLQIRERFLGFFRREKNMAKQRKDYHIYTCPNCKQKIRIPKGKGKICITCPKCKTEFTKKS